MNSNKLIKELKNTWEVRCKYWSVCNTENCDHYAPHHPHGETCLYNSPVKYCPEVRGFVHDVLYNGSYAEDECDPNLAFKAKRDAQHRMSGSSNFVELFEGETVDITTNDSGWGKT
jgi:hypothetical protein